jgi:branched-subunit amino acid aminotransferase/4-amino-4-deoxychorismate lyase
MAVIRFCRSLGIPVVEAFQTPEFFLAADEVFFSSASGLVAIDVLGDKTFGSHPIFNRLYHAYQDFVDNQ